MRAIYAGKQLSWWQSIRFKLAVRFLYSLQQNDVHRMIEHEIVRQRNILRTKNPDIDPLSKEYPDMDSVALNWGLDLFKKWL